ncbi:MAG: PorP/SprF family type IX secretion system membrane protein [Bacteroidota bacterium]
MSTTAKLFLGIILCWAPWQLAAQQLSTFNGWQGQEFIYNPAMTALDRRAQVNAHYEQEWSGFNDAPSTVQLSGQLAVNKQAMSLGAFLDVEELLPLRQNTIGFAYAYHLNGYGRGSSGQRLFVKRTRSMLSIGFSASMQQLFLDPGQLTVNDVDDQALPLGEATLTSPNFNAGVFFSGAPGGPAGMSYGFLGVAFRQILSDRLPLRDGVEESGLLDRSMHSNFTLGYHYETESLILRPLLWIDMAANAPSETQLSLQSEIRRKLIAGISYNLSQTLGIRLGYILPQDELGQRRLRIGAQGVFNLGSATAVRGLGYSAFIAYDFGRRADRLN